jgi:hypothetical protein
MFDFPGAYVAHAAPAFQGLLIGGATDYLKNAIVCPATNTDTYANDVNGAILCGNSAAAPTAAQHRL